MKKIILCIAMLWPVFAYAVDEDHQGHHNPAAMHLSEDVRILLRQEMQEIRKGMESLVFAVASGQWHEIETIGSKIQHSYILKKKLTENQKHELHQALPKDFKELDQRFHHYAGMLAHMAKERDIELVNYYVYKMNEACASCHAKFVSDKFSGFAEPNKHFEHLH